MANNGAGEKRVMVVGMDDSEHSVHALEWTLDHFFTPNASNPAFKLVIVHAESSPPAVSRSGPGISFSFLTSFYYYYWLNWINNGGFCIWGSAVLPAMDMDSKTTAARVVQKAKKICSSKSVRIYFPIKTDFASDGESELKMMCMCWMMCRWMRMMW